MWTCYYMSLQHHCWKSLSTIAWKILVKQEIEKMQGWHTKKYQKVHKQGRYDIKVKVNIQSPIPTSFYTTKLSCEKMQGSV